MKAIVITKAWYNDIKDYVKTANPYFFNEMPYGDMVEIDVDENEFNKVSAKKGWL